MLCETREMATLLGVSSLHKIIVKSYMMSYVITSTHPATGCINSINLTGSISF